MTEAEKIYHRFVRYEWEEISDTMKESILEAINEALKQSVVSNSISLDEVHKNKAMYLFRKYKNGNKSKPLLCEVFDFFGLQFNITQYRWGRKLYGGIWYKIDPKGLSMVTFWSRKEIKSCQSETIGFEIW